MPVRYAFAVVLALVLSGLAHAQQPVTVTLRSTGTMTATELVQAELGLPESFRYELVTTALLDRDKEWGPLPAMEGDQAGMTLIVGDRSIRFPDRASLATTFATYGAWELDGRQTGYFEHDFDIFTLDWYSVGGYHRGHWPDGSFPGSQDFSLQEWAFDGPRAADVFIVLSTSLTDHGWLIGEAGHFSMSISAVPESRQGILLVAGMLLLGLGGAVRRARPARPPLTSA
ncbi:hypothetical protein [Massilia niastensis]|uniref:hypothetical protein n=1 Tax=Massilia niastensis TaxID=544911 RepID=UPI0012EBA005|nr:hypothetical protein [Massilia niastensis]